MIVLALDPGTKRIGLAVSDPRGSFALPLDPVEVDAGEEHLSTIAQAAAERRVQRIVVGLPLRLDGTEGPAAQAARTFAAAVERSTGLAVELVDERLTTAQAEREMIGRGMRRTKRRGKIDSIAASVLLQGWLDAHREDEP